MSITLVRVLAAALAMAIVAAVALAVDNAEFRLARSVAAMQATDSLVQGTDIARIAAFQYINPTTLRIDDDRGQVYKMEFMAACPGLRQARDFSLATASFRDLDRFTGIVVDGQLCRFKTFAPS